MKIMMLTVEGQGPTWRRIVEVYDPVEFMGFLRARTLKQVLQSIEDEPGFARDRIVDNNTTLMRRLEGFKVKLKDTKMEKFPDTYDEYAKAYENAGAPIEEELLV